MGFALAKLFEGFCFANTPSAILKKNEPYIRSFTSVVTILRRNTGQFPWRRLSSFCSVRAILLPPAPLDRLYYRDFFGYRKVVCFYAPFSGWCLSYSVSNLGTSYCRFYCIWYHSPNLQIFTGNSSFSVSPVGYLRGRV